MFVQMRIDDGLVLSCCMTASQKSSSGFYAAVIVLFIGASKCILAIVLVQSVKTEFG